MHKASTMDARKVAEKKTNVDQTITDTSITTRTKVNDKVYIETEFPRTNANFLHKVNIISF